MTRTSTESLSPEALRKRRTTLLACFLHFDLSFMIWVLLGALGIPLSDAAHLTPSQKGLVVALPILAGSILRVPVGMLADRIGGKRVGLMLLAFLFLPLSLGWQLAPTFGRLLLIGGTLGVAGASFAVALPLASRWFPPEKQGLALGIAAAGNSGTVVTNLVAPRLAASIGIGPTFASAMGVVLVVFAAFALLAHEPPRVSLPSRPRLPSFKDGELRWMCLFYSITFGGYVGLSSFLPLMLRDRYGLPPITAGYITAGLAFTGSVARPLGGFIADKVGGARLLAILMVPIALAYGLESREPAPAVMVGLLALSMLCLGLGNGAVFQLVPRRFQRDIGAVTGVVGAIGGVGGFVLPTLLGAVRQRYGAFGPGFLVLAVLAAGAATCLWILTAPRGRWHEGRADVPAAE